MGHTYVRGSDLIGCHVEVAGEVGLWFYKRTECVATKSADADCYTSIYYVL